MKYINREYGFEGRPPYFKEYFEKKNKGVSPIFFKYPEKAEAGYGLEYSVPNGVLLAGALGSSWGIKISYQKVNKWVDSEEFLSDAGFFAADKDGKFTYFSHGDIAASIMNYSSSKIVMAVSGMSKVKVRLEMYPIAPYDSVITADGDAGTVNGVAKERAVVQGKITLNDTDMEIRDRYEIEYDEENARKEYFFAKSYSAPSNVSVQDNKVTLEYNLDSHFSRVVLFIAVGDESAIRDVPDIEEINAGSNKAELIYTAEKIMGSGLLGEGAANIVSRSSLHRIYDRYLQIPVLVEDRKKCNEYFSYNSTDMATGALILGLIGQYDGANKQLSVCVEDKILGALTAWILFCRTRNKNALSVNYQKLNGVFPIDGKLIEADKMTFRELAYKQYGSPFKDIKSEALYSLDMSCYKLIYLDVMSRISKILQNKSFEEINSARLELKDNINKTLFNEKLGLYMSRYLSGEFIPIYGADSFLPLIAGAVDDIDKLERVVLNLKDPKKFGGEFMVPSLSKNHPLYGKRLISNYGKDVYPYENYRGMITPLMNYFIYLGLKRYGVSEIESDLSCSCAKMYNDVLKNYNTTPDFYLPEKKMQSKNGLHNSLSGNLMGLIGMSEMLDVEYFREDMRPAIVFGTLAEGDHRLANVEMLGHKFSISITTTQTQLVMDGEEIFRGNGGKMLIRHFMENAKGAEFIIYAQEDTTINLTLPVFTHTDNQRLFTFNVAKGKIKIVIDKNNKINTVRLA